MEIDKLLFNGWPVPYHKSSVWPVYFDNELIITCVNLLLTEISGKENFKSDRVLTYIKIINLLLEDI